MTHSKSRLLQRALKRVLVLRCEIHDLRHFRFGDFIGEDAAYPDTLLMDMEHDACGLIGIHLKESFQHMDDEFHWRIIVIEEQHLIKARLLRLGAGARGEAYTRPTAAATALVVIFVGHHNVHIAEIGQGRG